MKDIVPFRPHLDYSHGSLSEVMEEVRREVNRRAIYNVTPLRKMTDGTYVCNYVRRLPYHEPRRDRRKWWITGAVIAGIAVVLTWATLLVRATMEVLSASPSWLGWALLLGGLALILSRSGRRAMVTVIVKVTQK